VGGDRQAVPIGVARTDDEAVSLLVSCESQEEVDQRLGKIDTDALLRAADPT
jgi:predicted 3-demethylubiquinone-9 3-methyltransferase (glyoxalase superfamily)